MLILIMVLFFLAFGTVLFYWIIRAITKRRNSFVCFEERGGTSFAMVKNGKVGGIVQADNGQRIILTEKLYEIRKGWDEIYLYKYKVVYGNRKKKIQKQSSLNKPSP